MSNDQLYKLIFYVPTADAERVKTSIFKTGAGSIGHYSHCSWETEGMGQFKPLFGSSPAIGTQDKLEKVPELKIEILCTSINIKDAVSCLKNSHPYEEPAFEIISIQNHLF
tara:strand:- start:40 stop:372 length:333 start_codon:yes stop_codon:yes gene_type:complete